MLAAHRILHVPPPYNQVILADTPSYFWPLDETSGTTANDIADSNPGTYQGTVTLGQPGIGDGETAVLFGGAEDIYTSTGLSVTPPPPLSIEIWCQVSNGFASGGTLIGCGNAQTGTPTNYDRMIWMDDSGFLYFGIYNGSTLELSSVSAYNDGHWHHVVGVLTSTSNMLLYVDGTLSASNTNTTAPLAYSGDAWWRIAYDYVNWPNNPSNVYMQGYLAKAAIYDYALTAAQIADHYAAA